MGQRQIIIIFTLRDVLFLPSAKIMPQFGMKILSRLITRFSRPLPYYYFGGANMMTSKQVEQVNGWSNEYWGWGGEDDDMRLRVAEEGFVVWRFPKTLARYSMLPHNQSHVNPQRSAQW